MVDFFVSWLAASHSFWTPAIYWMLNPKFRRALRRFFIKTVRSTALLETELLSLVVTTIYVVCTYVEIRFSVVRCP